MFERRLKTARQYVLDDDRVREFFHARMAQADELAADGEDDLAYAIWDATAAVFQNIASVADFQRYALRRRRREDADIPPIMRDSRE